MIRLPDPPPWLPEAVLLALLTVLGLVGCAAS